MNLDSNLKDILSVFVVILIILVIAVAFVAIIALIFGLLVKVDVINNGLGLAVTLISAILISGAILSLKK